MKTAIYIEDGVCQLVLTPENKFEQDALASFSEKPTETAIMRPYVAKAPTRWRVEC